MGYLTITSRHHDGFSTCDTALSDYELTTTARLGFYVAFLDWDHLADRETFRRKNGLARDEYVGFIHGQIRELCTNPESELAAVGEPVRAGMKSRTRPSFGSPAAHTSTRHPTFSPHRSPVRWGHAADRLTDPTYRSKIASQSTVDRHPSTPISRPRAEIFRMSDESHIHPLDQSRLGDEVAQMLRRAIISGELESGTHLVESVLSERFQVSRAPIREALRELEGEGLVESRRRGVYVKGLTRQDVWELYNLRTMLEGAAVELAVARFDETDIAALRGHLEMMTAAAATGRRPDFAKADMGFHTELFERIGHRRLLHVWRSFVDTYRVILEITDTENPDLDAVVVDHRQILDAIERRDAAEARRRDEESLRNGQAEFELRFSAEASAVPAPPKGGGGRS